MSEVGAIHCSWCGKSPTEVRQIVAGGQAFICNECIDSLHELIHSPLPALEESGDG